MADNPQTYFISDLHLEASRPAVAEAFFQFLHHTAKNAEAIYILGDFFNAWIGDDHRTPFIDRVKQNLRQCANRGTRIYFMHGNRDFLIGDRFAAETQLSLLDEETVIDLYGHSAVLLHGDSLCTDDIEYQKFRDLVREPSWQNQKLAYPLIVRRAIAAYMRFRSARINSNKRKDIMDVTQKSVDDVLRRTQVNLMIHGHTHRPKRHVFTEEDQQCERIVLGDWDEHGWYLLVQRSGFELISFPIND
ncbi:MAG: UDP-2,3-diacylglucosamine hydrolase [Lentisphaeria bacterium]|jgi:UDP-2,3-diacylglucosamine hydrolase